MKRQTLHFVGLTILLSGFCGVALAQLTPEQQKQAEALIEQFSAREFAVRQKAVEQLIQMGPGVLPLVQKTFAETKDAEVKLRCGMVINGIPAARRLVERRLKDLGPTKPPSEQYGPRRSANGESTAYAVTRDGKMRVIHDGKEEPEYDLAGAWGHIAFSPDGKRLAYIAKRGENGFIVCDGVEGPAYDGVYNPEFSPDGKRLAYIARRAKEYFVVCDAREWKDVRPRFSPDGKHLYGMGGRGKKSFVAIDDKAGALHDSIWLRGVLRNRLHYIAFDEDRLCLMEATWPADGEDQVTEVVWKRFPPSTLRIVNPLTSSYAPRTGEAELYTTYGPVTWGEGGDVHHDTGSLQFSPYGQHEAYAIVVKRGDKTAVIFRDRELGVYEQIHSRMCFSPDGNHLAYYASREGKWFVVRDGREGPACDAVQDITFSSDSRRLACVGRRAGEKLVMCDGKELGKYDDARELTFSPDGNHLAFVAKRGPRAFVVCDGQEGRAYQQVRGVVFSPDGSHLCYVANAGVMICDGIEGPSHDEIAHSGKTGIYPGKTLRYIVVDDNREGLVEVDWPKDLDWTHGLEPIGRAQEE